MRITIERRALVLRTARIAVRAMVSISRPMWLRYCYHDMKQPLESGTLRIGIVQIKWTRKLAIVQGCVNGTV